MTNKSPYTMKSLEELWEDLEDVCFDEDDSLEQEWHNFPIGTEKYEIWHWFEDQHKDFSVAEMMGIQ